MKHKKQLRIIVAIVCVLIATALTILTVSYQLQYLGNEYTVIQFLATCILDYGFMFVVWMLIDEFVKLKE